MRSPYEDLPRNRFWKTGVSGRKPLGVTDLYKKRFPIGKDVRIATAGSCFAQHIGRRLRARKFSVIDTEPAAHGVPLEISQKYGYGIYSARYGNIYTARQLLQLAREAYGDFAPANAVWRREGRFFDALRPSVEPEGFETEGQVRRHRDYHLGKVRTVLETAEVFVFTFGLTEAWIDRASGTVYPTAPGTIAGDYDPELFAFRNFSYDEVLADFIAFRELLKARNPAAKFLLTVSPVPLTATATESHVLVATTYSKSVLRAAAGKLYEMFDDVDYFPAYEIVATPFSRAAFFEPGLRSVTREGVDAVMHHFLLEHDPKSERTAAVEKPSKPAAPQSGNDEDEVVCEDILLQAFAK
jgi:hypothetical protein